MDLSPNDVAALVGVITGIGGILIGAVTATFSAGRKYERTMEKIAVLSDTVGKLYLDHNTCKSDIRTAIVDTDRRLTNSVAMIQTSLAVIVESMKHNVTEIEHSALQQRVQRVEAIILNNKDSKGGLT